MCAVFVAGEGKEGSEREQSEVLKIDFVWYLSKEKIRCGSRFS